MNGEAAFLAASAVILAGWFGFAIGKLSERVAWNRLIEQGILPKPRGRG